MPLDPCGPCTHSPTFSAPPIGRANSDRTAIAIVHTLTLSPSLTTAMPDKLELIHAYRKLLRAGLRAVQFSQPSRWSLTQQLRAGFRDPNGKFEPERIRRTIWFFNAAAQQRGIEHRILKNLCRVHWERFSPTRTPTWKSVLKQQEMRAKQEEKMKKGAKGR
jgi:Domain of unknown function (DUF1763).